MLNQFLEIAAQIEHNRKINRLKFYKPYPKQMEFHNAIGKGTDRAAAQRMFQAGNQIGKTHSGAMEAAIHLTGRYPDWWGGGRYNFPVEMMVGSNTNETCRDIIQKEMFGNPLDDKDIGTGSIPKDCIGKSTRKAGIINAIDSCLIKHHTDGVFDGYSKVYLRAYEQGFKKFMGIRFQVGWCIAKGQRIQMADGRFTPIEDIKVGDEVLTAGMYGKSVSKKVIATQSQGIRKIVDVVTRRGSWMKMTDDHEVYVSIHNKKKVSEAKRILQLSPGWEPNKTIDLSSAHYAWAGLFVSEGTFNSRKITMGECLAVESAIALLPKPAYVRKKEFNNNHVPDWFLNWKEFWPLVSSGLSHEKSVPDFVFTSSNSSIRIFLSYLFSGDGWAYHHSICYATTSRVLAEQVVQLLWRVGIRSHMNRRDSKVKEWRDQWWIIIAQSDFVVKFCDEIGIIGKENNVAKVREEAWRRFAGKNSKGYKSEKDKETQMLNRDRYSSIKRLEEIGESEVYDITVEDEHRFCCGVSIVSNCDEEPPQEIWSQFLRAQLAQKFAVLYITMTPEEGMTKVVTQFVNELAQGQALIQATWDDAAHFSEADKQEKLMAFPAHEREMRSKGVPMMGAGLVFSTSEENIVVDPFEIPRHWPQIIGIDFGWDHPFAACKMAWDRDNDCIYLTNEYRESKAIPAIHAMAIKAWGDWVPVAWPHDGLSTEKGTGEQLRDKYVEAGLNLLPWKSTNAPQAGQSEGEGGNSVWAGIIDMNQRMESGRFKVFSTCTQWLSEKRMYHTDKNGNLVKLTDDCISASRYATIMIRHARVQSVRPRVMMTSRGKSNWS